MIFAILTLGSDWASPLPRSGEVPAGPLQPARGDRRWREILCRWASRASRALLLMIAVVGSIPTAGPAAGLLPDRRTPTVRPFSLSQTCDYDRLMVGPDGSQVVIWAGDARQILGERRMLPPSSVVIGRLHPSMNSKEDKFFIYGGAGLRLFPIRWSQSGDRLFVRVREPKQRILTVGADGEPSLDESPLAQEWTLTDLTAISHGEIGLLNDPSTLARVRKVDGIELIRGSATIGSTVELIGARQRDLELVRLERNGAIETGINGGHTRLLTVFPTRRDYPSGISYLGAARERTRKYYRPYQLPIIDLATGRVAGSFGPAQLDLDRASQLRGTIDRFHRGLNAEGGKILDVSLSGRSLMALVLYPNGTERAIRLSAYGFSEKLICARRAEMILPSQRERDASKGSSPSLPIRYRILALNGQGREVAREGAPIVVHYSIAGTGPREAILYFHGGPGGSLSDDFWFFHASKLLRPDRDIIAVEYAGSVGGGAALTKRLSELGAGSVREDVNAIARWLAKKRYERIYLIETSFGSAPAMFALANHRPLFAASFHIAPLLKLKDPAEWSKRGVGFSPVNASTQLAYEFASFGGFKGRQRFVRELDSLLEAARLGSNDHFYFGGLDDISRASDLPSGTKATVTEFPRAGHAVLSANNELWLEIENYMQKTVASPNQVH